MKALLLERGLVALATSIAMLVCLGMLRELYAGVHVPSLAMPATMLIYCILLAIHTLRERELRKAIKAAGGTIGRWEKAIYAALGVGALAFVAVTQASVVSVAACIGVIAVGFLFSYRELQRMQAVGHVQ